MSSTFLKTWLRILILKYISCWFTFTFNGKPKYANKVYAEKS